MAKSGMSEAEVEDEVDEVDGQVVSGYAEIEKNYKVSVNVMKRVSTPTSILIESLVKNLCSVYESDSKNVQRLYKIVCDHLYQMNLIDESYSMNEFEGMRNQYQKAFHLLLKNSLGGEQLTTLSRSVWPSPDFLNSHYYREFDEINFIAGGGFGQVYKVKHKLDGTEYAIKKIPIRSQGIESVRNYLSEVKTFASLNHSNIVQYKAAWLELGSPSGNNNILTDTDSDSDSLELIKHNIDDEYIYHQDIHSFSDNRIVDSSDFEVDFEHSVNSITGCAPIKHARVKRDSVSEGDKAICKLDIKEIRELKIQQKSQVKWATLYIQMALCQSTLKQWLENRNDAEVPPEIVDNVLVPVRGQVRNETVYEVLRQLLTGLEYIHSKGIVHHDIKPSNIFIQLENGNLLVQLGDFGLACPLQSVRHSLAFGTKLYAAPEQLAGECNPKSDMYSVGIVLFELVEHFRTDMERVHFINELRKGHLPPHLLVQQQQLSQIIGQLVTKYPQDRPDATSLLKSITRTSDSCQKIQELECLVAEKNEEIQRLKELLKSAGVKSI